MPHSVFGVEKGKINEPLSTKITPQLEGK